MYSAGKYIAIHELILSGVTYDTIADLLRVNPSTVADVKKRYKKTGSALPSKTKKSKYDPYIRELCNRISDYMSAEKQTQALDVKTKLDPDDIFIFLKQDGFDVSRRKFDELYRLEKNRRKPGFLDLHFRPGEVAEFDWGHKTMNVKGINQTVCFAVFTLPYSDTRITFVTEREDGHSFARVFRMLIKKLEGVYPLLIIDNMKIARRSHKPTDDDKKLTLLFEELANHYGFTVRFCTPSQPNQKGSVENGVKGIKRALRESCVTEYNSLAEIQEHVCIIDEDRNTKMHRSKNDTRKRLLAHEKAQLQKVPSRHYTYYEKETRTVQNKSKISFHSGTYSVPEEYKGERVTVRFNNQLLYILAPSGDIIGKYHLSPKKKTKTYRIWHMLNTVRRKSTGFTSSEEYRSMPSWLKKLYHSVFLKDANRFISFLKVAHGKRKDFLKVTLRRNGLTFDQLSVETLTKEVARL